ncbi:hypothetical protein CWE21_00030 [Pseudidiomarina aquimaris]|uniref:Lipoprotein n=1 Tax=Pseudidiomarina aquimaris TaxID=641841 RepID=A0A432XPA8_9GAMM|nr:hypothetical protein [Pseudidiomarina aquimaris]RUO50527.1 hypothetical protein CWE21_00030 [Pseudidiomarina aquimaris]
MKFKIVMVAIMALITGCSQTTYSPQAAVSLAVAESKMAPLVSTKVEELSKNLGFTLKSSAGNAEHFAITNQFQTTFHADGGKSFIMIGNLISASCVRLAVYSEQGKEDADRIIKKLTKALQNLKNISMEVIEGPDCK